MLGKHLMPSKTPAKTFVERRRDLLNRAVVDGLVQLKEHMELLPEGPDKAAAMAAVACFAMRIATAMEKMNALARKAAARTAEIAAQASEASATSDTPARSP
jgi:hypothetical protein